MLLMLLIQLFSLYLSSSNVNLNKVINDIIADINNPMIKNLITRSQEIKNI